MSLARVKAWHKHFRDGWVLLADDAWSGTPHRITDDIIQLVGSVHIIMMERLNWHKVCTQWMPHTHEPQQEACQMAHCIDHLQHYAREGNEFLARVVAGNEFWCHHFEPESK